MCAKKIIRAKKKLEPKKNIRTTNKNNPLLYKENTE